LASFDGNFGADTLSGLLTLICGPVLRSSHVGSFLNPAGATSLGWVHRVAIYWSGRAGRRQVTSFQPFFAIPETP